MCSSDLIAKSKHPGAKLSLDALCSRYGIDRSHRMKHGALLDAELLTQLYIELTGGRQIGLGLGEDKATDAGAVKQSELRRPVARKEFMQPRAHQASEEELERHAAFVDGIKDALWASN